jgi:molecular chaperone GrpE
MSMDARHVPDPRRPTAEDIDAVEVKVDDRRFWARQEGSGSGESGASPPEQRYPSFVEELQARLKESEERLDATLASHRRMQAEFEQVRQRLQRDVELRVHEAKVSVFAGLLETADHLEHALAAAAEGGESFREGLRLIHTRLLATLKAEGVERIDLLGAVYDPELAEAVSVVAVADPSAHNLVVAEVRPGYRLGERLLRPAQVQVGRYGAPPAPTDSTADR